MDLVQAFEERGTWDDNGLAYLDGQRRPEFDIIDGNGMTHEDEEYQLEQQCFAVLREALNDQNKLTFDAMPRWQKRVFVAKAFEDNILIWSMP